jgi:hypothetical protein
MVEPEATSFYSSKSHHIDMFSYCLVSQRLGIDHKEIPTLLHSGIYIGKEFFCVATITTVFISCSHKYIFL